MRTCPKCFDVNVATATACKQCGLPFDLTAVNFARNCPAGRHVMDPTWTVCAFCKAEGLVTDDMGEPTPASYGRVPTPPPPPPRKTLFENDAASRPAAAAGAGGTHSEEWIHTDIPSINSNDPQRHSRTQFEGPPAASNPIPAIGAASDSDRSTMRKTMLDDSPAIPLRGSTPPPETPGIKPPVGRTAYWDGGKPLDNAPRPPQTAAGDQRRIVGILVTYTWKPEGQIFPVREGRNWIGRDPNQADITIEQDDTLSSVNSTISYRTRFVIGDKDSMGGTYVNGEPVEELAHPLPNYAKIRTGSTTWTFIAIEPPAPE